jgi:hypothetical protein
LFEKSLQAIATLNLSKEKNYNLQGGKSVEVRREEIVQDNENDSIEEIAKKLIYPSCSTIEKLPQNLVKQIY